MPEEMGRLSEVNDPEKRFCQSCERDVFFVRDRKELDVYKKLGRCVAANVPSPGHKKGIVIAGGVAPGNASIHIYGDQENVDEVMVALAYLQRKKRRNINRERREKVDKNSG